MWKYLYGCKNTVGGRGILRQRCIFIIKYGCRLSLFPLIFLPGRLASLMPHREIPRLFYFGQTLLHMLLDPVSVRLIDYAQLSQLIDQRRVGRSPAVQDVYKRQPMHGGSLVPQVNISGGVNRPYKVRLKTRQRYPESGSCA